MIWVSMAILLACAWLNKKAMIWRDWSRAEHERVKAQIAEVRQVNEYLNP